MTIRLLKTNMASGLALSVALTATSSAAFATDAANVIRAAVPKGAIEHIMVIDMENENFSATFGANSPAIYLNNTLLKQGELVTNYFATSHVSLGNYLAQISGQGPTKSINNDCIDLASLTQPPVVGGFTDIFPGTDAEDQVNFPGQIQGDGCVFPVASSISNGASTIADQLDSKFANETAVITLEQPRLNWRGYMEDMGNNPARDYGTPDPLGGTTCAHAPIGGADFSNSATANDQYATRHNPFMYFHSIIDDQARCDTHVVPLGKLAVGTNGAADVFSGHLYNDLRSKDTTPKFMFVTPNLCNDGHDGTCVAPNVEGTLNAAGKNAGGLVSADLWLKHWMPMIFSSPAYRSGKMLVVLTFDEAGFTDARACEKANQAECPAPVGLNVSNPGFSPILGLFHLQTPPTSNYVYPGGGQVGAVLFNKKLIKPGTVNNTGSYNHYSALRSYEDMLGITEGGDDGHGHLGFSALPTMQPFGLDVFNRQ